MNRILKSVAGCLVLLAAPLAGCAGPSKAGLTGSQVANLHTNLPLHRPTTAQKCNPCFWFGNVDDPFPPDDYQPEDPHRIGKWRWRNLCHNFTFYVMGIADKEFVRTGRFPDVVFNPHEGWNW